MPRAPQPDFLVIGAPKAGTTALHAALRQHPQVFVTHPKEPKYWLCDDAPPPHYCGPGDRHSQQEWIWRRDAYGRLFEHAPENQLRGEATPFYLWSRGAHRRIGEMLPEVKLVAVVRDPVDRAYSNWMHLWCDGLEPVGDFEAAFARQDERVRRGWAPFWRYRGLGLYGEQLAHLREYVDPARILVLRYGALVERPRETVDQVCRFLGLEEGHVDTIPRDNARHFVPPGPRPRLLGPVVRGAAGAAQFLPPELWRSASKPLVDALGGSPDASRPRLQPEQRARLIAGFRDDIDLLGELTGDDYSPWYSSESRGSFDQRAQQVQQVQQVPPDPPAVALRAEA
jgi:hypothetical protein